MIKGILLIILAVYPRNAKANEWIKEDTVLQATYSALHIVDWSQTLEIKARKNEGHGESNLILGRYPSRGKINRYFAGTLIGHYLVAMWLDKPYRNIWQSAWINIEWYYVNHNKRRGISIGLNF